MTCSLAPDISRHKCRLTHLSIYLSRFEYLLYSKYSRLPLAGAEWTSLREPRLDGWTLLFDRLYGRRSPLGTIRVCPLPHISIAREWSRSHNAAIFRQFSRDPVGAHTAAEAVPAAGFRNIVNQEPDGGCTLSLQDRHRQGTGRQCGPGLMSSTSSWTDWHFAQKKWTAR